MNFVWECLHDYADDTQGSFRARVFGGWVLKEYIIYDVDSAYSEQRMVQSMVFIPDPNHEWEIE